MTREPPTRPPIRMWLVEPLQADVKRAIDRIKRIDDVHRIAIMPDVHLAEGVCIGSVIATRRLIYPAAVGSDIGCGIATVALDLDGRELETPRCQDAWLRTIRKAVPIMRHRSRAAAPAFAPGLDARELSDHLCVGRLARIAGREGAIELGTLGRGNHFFEVQVDEGSRVWLMVHSGSRIMGQEITRFHTSSAVNAGRTGSRLVSLNADDDAGAAYLHDACWAVRYAAANRRLMLEAVLRAARRDLGAEADWQTFIDTNHNHVRTEKHGGQELLIHRKGAGSAAAGEPGLIPGSMGSVSFHTSGRGEPDSLCSSSHGAGRAMSRTEARRRISPRDPARQLQHIAFDNRMAAALREEAPAAYKDIHAVMRAQRDLVRIVRRVRAIVCYKGC